MPTNNTASRTLVRGLQLLELVAGAPRGAKVSSLAVASGLDKGTVSRLLATLREAGYVQQDPSTREYRLAGKVAALARSYLSTYDLRAAARPVLERLRDQVDETVHLAVRDGAYVVYVDQVQSSHALRHVLEPGYRLPLVVTAMGRAILAAEDPSLARDLIELLPGIKGYENFTSDLGELSQAVEEARRRGWASVERDDGVARAAAAILDHQGSPVAAISVSGPELRMKEHLEEIGSEVIAAAKAMGKLLQS